jgi:hypothetical protein
MKTPLPALPILNGTNEIVDCRLMIDYCHLLTDDMGVKLASTGLKRH